MTNPGWYVIIWVANGGSCWGGNGRSSLRFNVEKKAASLYSAGGGYFFMYPRIPKIIVAIRSKSANTSKAVMAITSLVPREE